MLVCCDRCQLSRRLLDSTPQTGLPLVSDAFWSGGENEIRNGIETLDDGGRGATQRTKRKASFCIIESDAGSVGVDLVPAELLTFSAPHSAQSDKADTCNANQTVERLVVAIPLARFQRPA